MCGRYVQKLSDEELARRFGIVPLFTLPRKGPRFNIKPTDPVSVILAPAAGQTLALAEARWSLTPAWSPTLAVNYPSFNARSETVLEKPAFREAALKQRCLIPASGYYEWHTEGRQKTPHYIHHRAGGELLFAGVYSRWVDPASGEQTLTATMLTAAATGKLAELHDRAPIFVAPGQAERWLDPSIVTDEWMIAESVAASERIAAELEHYPVAPLAGDGPELLERAAIPETPTLF